MDIKQLKYFIAIAEEGSLSAASTRLHVAQPSLSHHVVKVERELGVTLIKRSSRGVALTESGQILLKHAREICASMDVCRDKVRQSGGVPKGEVSFGMPSSVSMVLSVPLTETVLVEQPHIKLRVIEAMSGFIRAWLEDQTIDLAFLYEVHELRHCEVSKLMSEDLYFFAAPDNWPLATPPGTPVSLGDIQQLDLILPSLHHGLRQTLERHARTLGRPLDVRIDGFARTDQRNLLCEAVATPSSLLQRQMTVCIAEISLCRALSSRSFRAPSILFGIRQSQ
jgi:LysR family nitrogen assimilation transcriptional regulator